MTRSWVQRRLRSVLACASIWKAAGSAGKSWSDTVSCRRCCRRYRRTCRRQILLDNVFRPMTVPATGGFFSAILVFVLVLQLIAPGITVQAVPNDVPLNILRPAELITLSEYPASWAPEQHDVELSLPHGLLVDVTVDQHGQMAGYQILAGPRSVDLRRQLDQMLLFSKFRPMMSFGRPTSGGHVILSFSAVRVRG